MLQNFGLSQVVHRNIVKCGGTAFFQTEKSRSLLSTRSEVVSRKRRVQRDEKRYFCFSNFTNSQHSFCAVIRSAVVEVSRCTAIRCSADVNSLECGNKGSYWRRSRKRVHLRVIRIFLKEFLHSARTERAGRLIARQARTATIKCTAPSTGLCLQTDFTNDILPVRSRTVRGSLVKHSRSQESA